MAGAFDYRFNRGHCSRHTRIALVRQLMNDEGLYPDTYPTPSTSDPGWRPEGDTTIIVVGADTATIWDARRFVRGI